MTPAEPDHLEFEVLGPVVVRRGGRVIPLGTPKVRVTLALLLGRPNRAVSMDALVDSLWADSSPPKTAAKNVHVNIHHLRRALGDAERVVRQRPGYRLVVRAGELDADRFDDLARQGLAAGDPRRASELYRQALDLWTGDHAYADISGVPMVRAEAHRLDEARMTVLLNRVDAELRLGRHAELVPELTGLTAEHPLAEALWARLMTALYRAGRQTDALEAYDDIRRTLDEQIGLEPGPELQELQRAIVAAADPEETATADHHSQGRDSVSRDLAGLVPVPVAEPVRMLPPDVADFTGRTTELDRLEAMIRDGHRIVAISGPGGIGKSALATRLAYRLAASFDDGQLYANLAGAQPRPAEPVRILGHFLRALGVANAELSEDERASLYRSLLARRRVLVVLDDAAHEAQLRPLLPGAGLSVVIVTGRALFSLPGAGVIDLDVLPEDDGRRLLEKITGTRQDSPASGELLRLCAGLPLAVRVLGTRLATRPHRRPGDVVGRLRDERRRLDVLCHRGLAVRDSLALGYRRLRPRARRLFRLAGLIDAPGFAPWTAAAVLDTDLDEAGELLDEVIDARLLDHTDGRFHYHDLVRAYARERAHAEETEEDRAAALDRAFGGWLALTDAAHRVAGDGAYAARSGHVPRWRPDIAAALTTGPSIAEAVAESRALAAAVAQSARLGRHDVCAELAFGGVPIFHRGNLADEWLACQERAFSACSDAGDPRGQAVMWYSRGLLHGRHRRHDQARICHEHARRLFDDLGDRHGGALAVRELAAAERLAGRLEQAIVSSRRAHDLLRELDDPGAAAGALVRTGVVRLDTGDAAAAVETLTEAMRQARTAGARPVLARCAYWIGIALIRLGRLDDAGGSLGAVEDFAREAGSPQAWAYAGYGGGLLRLARGETEAARARLEPALEAARENGDPLMRARVLRALARTEPSSAGKAAGLAEALEIGERLRIPLAQARALVDLGRLHAGRGEIESARTAWARAARLFREAGSSRASEAETLLTELGG